MSSPRWNAVDQLLLTGDVREHAQLHLRVVGADEALPLVGVEGATDPLPPLGAHRDVLQVRIRRRETAGGCDGLVERRVHARIGGAQQRQRIDVGALQLGELPPFEDAFHDGMLVAQRFERVGIRAPTGLGLAPAREAEVVVEKTSELLRAPGVERVPGDLLHLALDLGDPRDTSPR